MRRLLHRLGTFGHDLLNRPGTCSKYVNVYLQAYAVNVAVHGHCCHMLIQDPTTLSVHKTLLLIVHAGSNALRPASGLSGLRSVIAVLHDEEGHDAGPEGRLPQNHTTGQGQGQS